MSSQLVRLLSDDDTLYGVNPSYIAREIVRKLNELSLQGWNIVSVSALPDHHSWGADGGVKDIFFLCDKEQKPPSSWFTALVIPDSNTMYQWKTETILHETAKLVKKLEEAGNRVIHLVSLTDHHESAMFSGIGGYDGVKNIIVCFI